jgi:hypothetical protein
VGISLLDKFTFFKSTGRLDKMAADSPSDLSKSGIFDLKFEDFLLGSAQNF